METYGVFALSGQAIAIIAIAAAGVTLIASFLLNALYLPIYGIIAVIVAFVMCAILTATFWTSFGPWMAPGGIFLLIGGMIILAIPFLAFVEPG